MSSLLAVTALLAVVLVVVAAVVVVVAVLVVRARRAQPRDEGPVAAPGAADARAEAAGLTLALDEQVARSLTSLEFARIQLGDGANDELARAVEEGRAAGAALGLALATTEGAGAHGPGGTAAAGRLAVAISRGRSARDALAAAEARVADATRRLDPPDGGPSAGIAP